MADHYLRAVEHLHELDDLRHDLRQEYRDRSNPKRVADLQQAIGVTLKLADIHSHLAIVQALQERTLAS